MLGSLQAPSRKARMRYAKGRGPCYSQFAKALDVAITRCMIVFRSLEEKARRLRIHTASRSLGRQIWIKLRLMGNSEHFKERLAVL